MFVSVTLLPASHVIVLTLVFGSMHANMRVGPISKMGTGPFSHFVNDIYRVEEKKEEKDTESFYD